MSYEAVSYDVTIANGQSEGVIALANPRRTARGGKLCVLNTITASDFLIYTSDDNGVTYRQEKDDEGTPLRVGTNSATGASNYALPAEAWMALQASTHVKFVRVTVGGTTPVTTNACPLRLWTVE